MGDRPIALLVQSFLLLPKKQTFVGALGMSASGHFRTHAPQQAAFLFDHLVGECEQLVGHDESE
jgi:hypothetical protein